MTFRAASASILLLAALAASAPLFAAREGSVEELCRLHGIGDEGDLARIRRAYANAVEAGISEEEMYPFVEDILRHKLSCAQMVRVLSVASALKADGLPYFVVFSKVREGVAKEAPPALVVEAAEAKLRTLTQAREVLDGLASAGYRVRDFQNAAVIVSSYIEKGYAPDDVVLQVRNKGVEGAGFAALSGVVEKPVNREVR